MVYEQVFPNYCIITDCVYKGVGGWRSGGKWEAGYTFQ